MIVLACTLLGLLCIGILAISIFLMQGWLAHRDMDRYIARREKWERWIKRMREKHEKINESKANT